MKADDARAQYVAALNAIIADDPVTGPLVQERAAKPDAERLSVINNTIANVASEEVQAALKALRAVR